MGKGEVDELPKIIECHCCFDAHRYRVRTFVNKFGHTVYRAFYRCENCLSRIVHSYIPELDKLPSVCVLDLIKQNNTKLLKEGV